MTAPNPDRCQPSAAEEPPVSTEACAELAQAGVATVYEAAGRRGLIEADLEQLSPGTRAAGPARIAACAQDDNWAVHKVMDVLSPGEVLVAAMPEPRPVALVGELLMTQAKVRGAAGVLVDSAARDIEEIRDLGLPVWTRWRRVRGALRATPGQVDAPVVVGGQRICPGDIVVLDADGAVAVPAADVSKVLEATRARLAREASMRERLHAGEISYDIHGLRAKEEEQEAS